MCNNGVWDNKPSQAAGSCLDRHQVDNALVIKVRKKLSLCLQFLLTRAQLFVSHLCYSHMIPDHVTKWTNGTCRYWKESLSTLNLPGTSSQSWSQVTSCSLVSVHSKRTDFHSLYGLKIRMKILLGEYCSCRNPRYAFMVGSMLCKLKCVCSVMNCCNWERGSKRRTYRQIPLSTDPVSMVSVICSLPRPEKKLEN